MGFSFPRAALGLTVVFSLSLGWISFQYYQQQTKLLRFFENETRGIDTAKELTTELISFSTSPQLDRPRADQSFRLMRKVIHEAMHDRKDLREALETASGIILLQGNRPLDEAELHRMTQLQKSLLRALLEQSNLILDPSFRTYYLVDALFSQLPDVVYYHHSWQELLALRTANKHELLFQEIGARKAAYDRFQASLSKALTATSVDPLVDRISLPAGDLTARTTPLLGSFAILGKIDSAAFNEQLQGWGEAAVKVLTQGADVFRELNARRLTEARRNLVIALTVCLISWVVSLAFLGFIVYTFFSSRRLLQQVIRDQRSALSRAQKFATLGEMSASIGHEIANPLTIIKTTTELLERNFGQAQPGILKHSERIRRMATRIEDIVHSMKVYLNGEKDEDIHPLPVDIVKILNDVREDVEPRLQSMHAQLDINAENQRVIMVLGNYNEFVQVFTNLVNNALDAVKESPKKEVHIRVHNTDAFTEVEVQDTGAGIPNELRGRIFEALFTTKNSGEGTGLGLSIAQKIVSKYQGNLRLTDKGPGACFEVSLNRYFS